MHQKNTKQPHKELSHTVTVYVTVISYFPFPLGGIIPLSHIPYWQRACRGFLHWSVHAWCSQTRFLHCCRLWMRRLLGSLIWVCHWAGTGAQQSLNGCGMEVCWRTRKLRSRPTLIYAGNSFNRQSWRSGTDYRVDLELDLFIPLGKRKFHWIFSVLYKRLIATVQCLGPTSLLIVHCLGQGQS